MHAHTLGGVGFFYCTNCKLISMEKQKIYTFEVMELWNAFAWKTKWLVCLLTNIIVYIYSCTCILDVWLWKKYVLRASYAQILHFNITAPVRYVKWKVLQQLSAWLNALSYIQNCISTDTHFNRNSQYAYWQHTHLWRRTLRKCCNHSGHIKTRPERFHNQYLIKRLCIFGLCQKIWVQKLSNAISPTHEDLSTYLEEEADFKEQLVTDT